MRAPHLRILPDDTGSHKLTEGGEILSTGQLQPIGPWRFTVYDLEKLISSGMTGMHSEWIEVVEGVLCRVSVGHRRNEVIPQVAHALARLTTAAAGPYERPPVVVSQPRIRLSRHTLVRPDVALLRSPPDELDYRLTVSVADDVLLLVEIADESEAVQAAQKDKIRVHGQAGIAETWLVEPGEVVWVYRRVGGGGYEVFAPLMGAEELAPVALPRCRVQARNVHG